MSYDMSADPMLFFSTAAGPDAQDLYGPSQSVLDVYANGAPMSAAQTAIANSVGGSGGAPWYARGDVHALAFMVVGAVMVHLHMES